MWIAVGARLENCCRNRYTAKKLSVLKTVHRRYGFCAGSISIAFHSQSVAII